MPDNAIVAPQVPDMLHTLSGVMNIAGAGQQVQRQAVETQQAKMDLQERNALRGLMAKLQEYEGADGGPDYTRLMRDALTVAPKLGPAFVQQVASAHVQNLAAQSGMTALSEERRGALGKTLMAVSDQPLETQLGVINSAVQGNPTLRPWADIWVPKLKAAANNPAALKNTAMLLAESTQPVATTTALKTPEGPAFNTGQVSGIINVKPTAGPVGPVSGTTVQNVLPPTQPTFNPATQTPGVVGVQPVQGAGGIQTGPALGQPETAAGVAASAVTDWNNVKADAAKASQDIGVLQEIKKYAPGAAAGVISDRRAFIAGLAGLVGMDVGEMSKTETDLLAKNSNMIALAGGDTNLARTMAEMANPNIHMTKEAIVKAANQVIGQRQMALARQQFLLPHISSPQSYAKALTEFNQHADPRVLQLPSLSVQEKVEMKKAMSPAEQRAFATKVRWMQDRGILR